MWKQVKGEMGKNQRSNKLGCTILGLMLEDLIFSMLFFLILCIVAQAEWYKQVHSAVSNSTLALGQAWTSSRDERAETVVLLCTVPTANKEERTNMAFLFVFRFHLQGVSVDIGVFIISCCIMHEKKQQPIALHHHIMLIFNPSSWMDKDEKAVWTICSESTVATWVLL